MKKLLLPVFLVLPACLAPDADDASVAAAEARVEEVGSVAGGVATAVTGNPAIGIGVSAIVVGVGGWFANKRRKAAKAPTAVPA